MKINTLTDAENIKEGEMIEIKNSRRTGTFHVTWLGLIDRQTLLSIEGLYFGFKYNDIMGIAYVDNIELIIADTEISADEMSIPEDKIKKIADAHGLQYDHLLR